MRPFWHGSITFGLVTVPVNLFPATVRRRVAFKMVAEEGSPVRRRYVCSKDEQELEQEDIVRGYEIEKGKFVLVSDDELEAIEPRKTREIDLRLFVSKDEIDPMYFDHGYFLTPAGGSNKAYRLLAEVMEKSGRAGIATFVMRAKEYLIAIMAEKGILRAETLRFADELRTPGDINLPDLSKPKASEVLKFEKLITKQSKKLDASLMLDDYAERVEALVEKKQQKGADILRFESKAASSDDEENDNVVDLMAALRRSLGQAPSKAAAPAPKTKSAESAKNVKKLAAKKVPASKTSAKTAAKKSSTKKAASTSRKGATRKRA